MFLTQSIYLISVPISESITAESESDNVKSNLNKHTIIIIFYGSVIHIM